MEELHVDVITKKGVVHIKGDILGNINAPIKIVIPPTISVQAAHVLIGLLNTAIMQVDKDTSE